QLSPGDFVFCPEGRAGLHAFRNPTDEPARILAMSAGSFPDVVAYPEHGYAWVATRDPDPALLARGGDPGIIARFEVPIEETSQPSGRPEQCKEAAASGLFACSMLSPCFSAGPRGNYAHGPRVAPGCVAR